MAYVDENLHSETQTSDHYSWTWILKVHVPIPRRHGFAPGNADTQYVLNSEHFVGRPWSFPDQPIFTSTSKLSLHVDF